jgi:hypothetical protein
MGFVNMVGYCMKDIDEDHFQFVWHNIRGHDGGWDVKFCEAQNHDNGELGMLHLS